jgi:hypothetical protein
MHCTEKRGGDRHCQLHDQMYIFLNSTSTFSARYTHIFPLIRKEPSSILQIEPCMQSASDYLSNRCSGPEPSGPSLSTRAGIFPFGFTFVKPEVNLQKTIDFSLKVRIRVVVRVRFKENILTDLLCQY